MSISRAKGLKKSTIEGIYKHWKYNALDEADINKRKKKGYSKAERKR